MWCMHPINQDVFKPGIYVLTKEDNDILWRGVNNSVEIISYKHFDRLGVPIRRNILSLVKSLEANMHSDAKHKLQVTLNLTADVIYYFQNIILQLFWLHNKNFKC